jgi:hypothetical protein
LHFEKLLEIIYLVEKYETTLPHHDFFFSTYIKFLKKIHSFLICKSPYSLGLWYFYLSVPRADIQRNYVKLEIKSPLLLSNTTSLELLGFSTYSYQGTYSRKLYPSTTFVSYNIPYFYILIK